MTQSRERKPSITIYLEEEQHTEFKMAAIKSRRAMADIGRELVEAYLAAYEQDHTVDTETVITGVSFPAGASEKLEEIQRLINEILAVEK